MASMKKHIRSLIFSMQISVLPSHLLKYKSLYFKRCDGRTDGTRITFTDGDQRLQIIEAATGRLLTSYKLPSHDAVYSPDCTYFAKIVEEIMEIREVATGHVITSYKVSDTADRK